MNANIKSTIFSIFIIVLISSISTSQADMIGLFEFNDFSDSMGNFPALEIHNTSSSSFSSGIYSFNSGKQSRRWGHFRFPLKHL